MRKLLRAAGFLALGSLLCLGCQKKEVTTTDTGSTYATTPEATPASTMDTTTPAPDRTPTP